MDKTSIHWAQSVVAALAAFRVAPEKRPVPLSFLPTHPAQDQIAPNSPLRRHYDDLAAHVASFNSGTLRIAKLKMPDRAHEVPSDEWNRFDAEMRQRATRVITAAQRV